MPLEFPDNVLRGRSRQPFAGGMFKDFAPTVVGNKAGENIGIDPNGAYTADMYPAAPERQPMNMLMQSGDREVKNMILGTSTTDKQYARKYAGFSEAPAKNGEPISSRVAGQLYLPVGSVEVNAGDLVVPEFSNTAGNQAGDVIPFVDPASSDTPLTSQCHYASMIVGRAISGGAVRVDEDNFSLAIVVLRGF